MEEERMRILKMIETGKISAEEGLKLLEALDAGQEEKQSQPESGFGKILNIKISDSTTGEVKVNLKVPLGIAHIIKSLIPETEMHKLEERGINLDLLFQNIDAGASGRLLEVEDTERNQLIQINIE
jgi:DUF4097 and DUF4098 domain-containing protein YvlB